MKKIMNRLMGISLLSLLLIASTGQNAKAQDVVVSYQTFYDNLAPYGQWVNDPVYGNVWVPNEAGDFRPYGSRGHWAMTDYGNTWVSEDPWGWAVYHYGRWTYDAYYGWVWIPGYEWAPAWVSWRYGGGYSGWAPMGPGVNIGVSFNYPDSWWIFVAPQYMYRPNCYSYWRGPSYNPTYIRQTTIINNYYVDNSTHVRYNYGPRRDVIERDTRQPVEVYRVERTNRPGAPNLNGNRVNMYRPAVERGSASNARPTNVMDAPRRVGRPQAANSVASGSQAPFRQVVQRQNPDARNNSQRQPAQASQPGQRQNNDQRPQDNNQRTTTPQDRGQRSRQQAEQRNDAGTGRQQPQRSEASQQRNAPAPMRQQPQAPQQPQRQAPQRQQPQAPQQPQRQAPQRQQTQAPQRQMPQPQRQQPQAPRPQQPQRQMPQPQRAQPQPQRQAPQPQQRPMPQGGREQGGRR